LNARRIALVVQIKDDRAVGIQPIWNMVAHMQLSVHHDRDMWGRLSGIYDLG
jgi:hypothetical protein